MEGVSVIIPVYNEGRIIGASVRRLLSYMDSIRPKQPYEIIVVDNGSTDNTASIAEGLTKDFPKKVKLVSLPERGVGNAFKAAAKAARYDKLVSIDADLTIDFRSFIPKCLKLLRTHSIVVGSKHAGKQSRPMLRMVLSTGFILMTRGLLGVRLTDHSIGAKGYRRKDILPFMGDVDAGSFYVTALVYRVSKSGKRFTEIPVMCRDTRRSKFSLWREVLYRFHSLLMFWLRETIA